MLRVDFVENSRRVMAEAFPRKLQSYELNFMEGHRNLAKVPRFPFGADVEGFTGVLFDEDGPTLIISLWIVKVLLLLSLIVLLQLKQVRLNSPETWRGDSELTSALKHIIALVFGQVYPDGIKVRFGFCDVMV
eukprot:TRINITY_DN601_c0_g1_i12.p1 TRINITY_DN601_c0_g1~~TRINITY_DN601_c0_g1_i12.p1  ORF type:complete len:147 (-),score=17.15 TRINITY_DN601_c0_g1_i12:447-845(-)